MIKIFIQVTKIIIATILAIFMQSCGSDFNFNRETIDGNGNVTTVKRNINGSFTSIEAKNGLDVLIEQGNSTLIQIEADENLHSHIFTEIKNNVLIIHTDANFVKSKMHKVYVQLPEVKSIKSSSGAFVKNIGELKSPLLSLDSSSGSTIELEVYTENLNCESSSGSEIIVSGKTTELETKSSSGSEINLSKLIADNAKAISSSGSSTVLNATNNLNAEASSGSSIDYLSKPLNITKEESSGGSVN